MLKTINQIIKPGNILSFKLVTGEEMVAKVLDFDDKEIEVLKPVVLINTPEGIAMSPALMQTSETERVIINRANIIVTAKTANEVESTYIQMETGIAVPSKNIIT